MLCRQFFTPEECKQIARGSLIYCNPTPEIAQEIPDKTDEEQYTWKDADVAKTPAEDENTKSSKHIILRGIVAVGGVIATLIVLSFALARISGVDKLTPVKNNEGSNEVAPEVISEAETDATQNGSIPLDVAEATERAVTNINGIEAPVYYRVTASTTLNVRSNPDASSERLGSLKGQTICQGTGNISEDGKWAEVYFGEGQKTGWVSVNYLQEVDAGDVDGVTEMSESDTTQAETQGEDTKVTSMTESTGLLVNNDLSRYTNGELNRKFILCVGERVQPSASIWNGGISISDEAVISVDDDGTITAKKVGTANVVYYGVGSMSMAYTVVVE